MNRLLGIFSSAKGTLSCKRVCGTGGLVVIFVCYVYSVKTGCELPGCTEFLAGMCGTLIGADTVAKALGGKNKEE